MTIETILIFELSSSKLARAFALLKAFRATQGHWGVFRVSKLLYFMCVFSKMTGVSSEITDVCTGFFIVSCSSEVGI